jgi:hypothetical protein
LSGPLRFNVYYLLVGLTAVWVALDSKRIRIQEYRTQLAVPPVALLALVVIVWPLAFPLYLRTRHRIGSGEIEAGPYDGARLRPVLWFFGIFAVLVAAIYFLSRKATAPLMPVANGISEMFGVPVNVKINGTYLTLTLPKDAVPDSTRRAFSRQIASCTKKLYAERLNKVSVSYAYGSKRGAITTTWIEEDTSWWASDLEAFCPARKESRIGIPK